MDASSAAHLRGPAQHHTTALSAFAGLINAPICGGPFDRVCTGTADSLHSLIATIKLPISDVPRVGTINNRWSSNTLAGNSL